MMDQINNLPNELLEIIFKKLDVKDFLSCRLVCRKWFAFFHSMKPTELIVKKFEGPTFHEKWYFTNGALNVRNEVILAKLSLIGKLPLNLQNLTRLHINFTIKSTKSDISSLSRLKKLEQLQIQSLSLVKWNQSLVLPSLKILYIFEVFACNVEFTLDIRPRHQLNFDAPQLKVLGSGYGLVSENDFVSLNILHPENVEHLHVVSHSVALRHFRNVKIFKCNNMFSESGSELNHKCLEFFPKLQELHCDQYFIEGPDDCESVALLMNHLIVDRKILNTQHVKIYFGNIEITDDKIFEDYGIDLLSRIEEV